MKVFNISTLAVIALLINGGEAITIRPNNINDVQIQQQSKAQTMIKMNADLFAELNMKIKAVQKAAGEGDAEAASLKADDMNNVVDKVSGRWLGSIDKEDPEIVDDFLHQMQDAVREIHKTEGFMNVKVAKARDSGDDWLTKVVKGNKAMQALIPEYPGKEDRVAVADS